MPPLARTGRRPVHQESRIIKMMRIAIAGKNQVAIDGMNAALALGMESPVYCVANRSDDGTDRWQPSFRKCAASSGRVELVDLDDLFDIDDLLFFSLEFDRILKPERFRSAALFNLHFSLLPAYRGMYTSTMPLRNGEAESGVTLHRIDDGIDTGPVVAQRSFPILIDDTARDLYFKYMRAGSRLFRENLDSVLLGNFSQTDQPETGSSYTSRSAIDYGDLKIDMNRTASQVHNQIRAYIFREYQLPAIGGIPIYRSQMTDIRSGEKPGTLSDRTQHTLRLATSDYDLILFPDRFDDALAAIRADDHPSLRQILAQFASLADEQDPQGQSLLGQARKSHAVNCLEILESAGS